MTLAPRPWPKDVEPLAVEDLEKLGINGKNELYWNGRRLFTQIHLTIPQKALALLTALAAIATVATGLNNASIFLCARGNSLLTCPIASPIQSPTPVQSPVPASRFIEPPKG